MRETRFIELNKEKWQEFEKTLRSGNQDPDKLSNLFVEVTDDLSYSRTFYPNRSVRVYLNSLAQRVFYNIYKNRRNTWKRFKTFWADDLPQVVYESRREFLLSFGIFLLSMLIGVLSTHMNPDFPRLILGDEYVNMTLENIEKGDPMAVYKDPDSTGMALQITWNNLRVAFLTFVLGLFFSLGTIMMLIRNGIMVGAFQYFFYQHGVFWDSFLTIWIHGTLEISAIIIAGAAGMALGRGLVFPGTLSRTQALQLSGRRALSIMAGIAPVIIMAGMIEGFITRYTEVAYSMRFVFILISLAFILFYYRWYPWRKAKKGAFMANLQEVRLPPTPKLIIDYTAIKSVGSIFADAFVLYRKRLSAIFWVAFSMSAIATFGLVFWQYKHGASYFNFEDLADGIYSYNPLTSTLRRYLWLPMINNAQFFDIQGLTDPLFIINLLVFTPLAYMSMMFITKDSRRKETTGLGYKVAGAATSLFFTAIYFYQCSFGAFLAVLCFFLVTPVLFSALATIFTERLNPAAAVSQSLRQNSVAYTRNLGVYLTMLLMTLVMSILIIAPLSGFYFEFLAMLLPFGDDTLFIIKKAFMTFSHFLALSLSFPLAVMGIAMATFVQREILEAESLLKKIATIGVKRKSYGMEKE